MTVWPKSRHTSRSMGELLDIVGAMRSLAGMRVQEAQHALPGIRRYAAVGGDGNRRHASSDAGARAARRAARGDRALILCTAEHGFVGGFNERLVDAAEPALRGRRSAVRARQSRRGARTRAGTAGKLDTADGDALRCRARNDPTLASELYRRIAAARLPAST